ncbi:MAG TPA: ribosome maturation factor RimP [Streptosporangiaceae bacterium]
MAAGPDTDQVMRVAEPVIHALGMDLESVKVTTAGRRRLLRVVVDSDHGLSLDDAAVASRELSATLDASDVMGDMPYTLEVSSPGVDRPLTQPRHWRRAVGRLVRVALSPAGHGKPGTGHGKPGTGHGKAGHGKSGAAPGPVQGRVIAADGTEVTLDIDGEHRRFGYVDLGPGRVQVEFDRQEPRPGAEPPDVAEPPESEELPPGREPGAEPDGH